MTLTRFRLLPLLMLVALLSVSASAKVLLKPSGESADAISLKSLTADISITGQFAKTTQTLIFQNECEERIEADFIYTLPQGAVATYFAYWADKEKVVARIVEKERAAAIYKAITTRQRDPALIELIGKNTFRARIFPVMPNADLKVEIHFVQPLPSNASGATYTLPLFEDKNAPALESLNVKVRVRADASISGVSTNYGLPIEHTSDGYALTLSGTNYRPPKDLSVQVKYAPSPLRASLYSAPSGGTDGFFALAITPEHSLSKVKLTISGVGTYDLSPMPTTAKANKAIMLYGRYKGSGAAVVTLDGVSPDGPFHGTSPLIFSLKPEQDNLATKLWAAAKIEQLGAKNRAKVLSLSKRFTLPSKYTSWLAVPKKEMELYRREKAEQDAYATAQQIAKLIFLSKGSSPQARSLQSRLNALCKLMDDKRSRQASNWVNDAIAGYEWNAGRELSHLIATGQNQSARAKYLLRVFTNIARSRKRTLQAELNNSFSSKLADLASDLAKLQHYRESDKVDIASLRQQIARLERTLGRSARPEIEEAERRYLPEKIESARDELLREWNMPILDPSKAQSLEKKFTEINARYKGKAYAKQRSERLKLKWDIDIMDSQIMVARRVGDAPKEAQIAQQQAKLVTKEAELRVRMGDPLIAVDAPEDAEQVVALMRGGEIKPLHYNQINHRWEARFDVPAYAKEGDYVINITVILHDGVRQTLQMRYAVDLTPPEGKPSARLTSNRKLRLEADCSPDTARVVALTPWGGRIPMSRSTQPHSFFALTPVPNGDWTAASVTFILTDKAHNRTVLTTNVEVAQ